MSKSTVAIGVVLSAGLALGGCGTSSNNNNANQGASPTGSPAATGTASPSASPSAPGTVTGKNFENFPTYGYDFNNSRHVPFKEITADNVKDLGIIWTADLKTLDQKVGRRLDDAGREVGLYKRIEVSIAQLGAKEQRLAITYQGVNVEKYHIPPTQHYMDLVVQGAYANGLSMMWISYLQSFGLQRGRQPRPQGDK